MRWFVFIAGGFMTISAMAENLLKNPDFSAEGDYRKDWALTTMCDQVFDLTYDKAGKFVDLESTGTEYSGYLNQFVPVKPNVRYRLRVDMRLVKGRCLLWIVGLNRDRRPVGYQRTKFLSSFVGHPLSPYFVPNAYMYGSDNLDWRWEELEFLTEKPEKSKDELAYVKVNVGVYFSTGKIQVRKVELSPIEGGQDRPAEK